ncbi:hypothetical protein LEN26_017417 [Aphanomyces euteiches]|nr:hypothetical protein LEN26_017417 [Aphanomyces euteiches]
MNIRNRTRQLREFQAVARTTQRMVYLEPSREDPTDKDYIYNESYALPLVQRILLGMNSSINLTAVPLTHALIVDCDYDGRYYQDTTMFKIFLVDVALQSISSIALQTMNAMRETTKLETQVGATVVSQAQLDRFRLGPDDPPDAPWLFGLTYDGATDYRTLVSLYFPYEDDTPFLETHHDGILPSNEYAWCIRATNESMSVAGYSGYYQGSKESQTNILRYLMDMTGNPIRDFVVDYYVSLSYTKDAWTWIQGLVILTIGVRVALTTVVALSIALTTSKSTAHLPDVFPTSKRHPIVPARACLRLRRLLVHPRRVPNAADAPLELWLAKRLVGDQLWPGRTAAPSERSTAAVRSCRSSCPCQSQNSRGGRFFTSASRRSG